MSDQPKNRKFLKPMTIAVAAVVAVAATKSMVNQEVQAAVEKASESIENQAIAQSQEGQFVLEGVTSQGIKTSYHGSHASHSSHSSHASSGF